MLVRKLWKRLKSWRGKEWRINWIWEEGKNQYGLLGYDYNLWYKIRFNVHDVYLIHSNSYSHSHTYSTLVTSKKCQRLLTKPSPPPSNLLHPNRPNRAKVLGNSCWRAWNQCDPHIHPNAALGLLQKKAAVWDIKKLNKTSFIYYVLYYSCMLVFSSDTKYANGMSCSCRTFWIFLQFINLIQFRRYTCILMLMCLMCIIYCAFLVFESISSWKSVINISSTSSNI